VNITYNPNPPAWQKEAERELWAKLFEGILPVKEQSDGTGISSKGQGKAGFQAD